MSFREGDVVYINTGNFNPRYLGMVMRKEEGGGYTVYVPAGETETLCGPGSLTLIREEDIDIFTSFYEELSKRGERLQSGHDIHPSGICEAGTYERDC